MPTTPKELKVNASILERIEDLEKRLNNKEKEN